MPPCHHSRARGLSCVCSPPLHSPSVWGSALQQHPSHTPKGPTTALTSHHQGLLLTPGKCQPTFCPSPSPRDHPSPPTEVKPPCPLPCHTGRSSIHNLSHFFFSFLRFIISNHVNNLVKHPVGKATPQAPAEGSPWAGGQRGPLCTAGSPRPTQQLTLKTRLRKRGGIEAVGSTPCPPSCLSCPSGWRQQGGVGCRPSPPKAHSWGVGWPWRMPPPRST